MTVMSPTKGPLVRMTQAENVLLVLHENCPRLRSLSVLQIFMFAGSGDDSCPMSCHGIAENCIPLLLVQDMIEATTEFAHGDVEAPDVHYKLTVNGLYAVSEILNGTRIFTITKDRESEPQEKKRATESKIKRAAKKKAPASKSSTPGSDKTKASAKKSSPAQASPSAYAIGVTLDGMEQPARGSRSRKVKKASTGKLAAKGTTQSQASNRKLGPTKRSGARLNIRTTDNNGTADEARIQRVVRHTTETRMKAPPRPSKKKS